MDLKRPLIEVNGCVGEFQKVVPHLRRNDRAAGKTTPLRQLLQLHNDTHPDYVDRAKPQDVLF